jgi:hypothetical protein
LADRSAWCTFAGIDFGGERVMIEFKGSHFERDVILSDIQTVLPEQHKGTEARVW